MKRQHLQKITSGFLVFCLMLSFSISSLAAAFTGAYMTTETDPVTGQVTTVIKDVNPSGQTFTGQNVIEMNAYNNAPTLTNNTFNGSTDINPDFTSITSSGNAYNGSVDINYDGLGGTLDSNGDRFQSTTVTAQQSDISISNGTFNGSTTINAQSVSLGSITQMDELLDYVAQLAFFFSNYNEASTDGSPWSKQITWNGHTVTVSKFRITQYSYDSATNTITSTRHANFLSYINFMYYILNETLHTLLLCEFESLKKNVSDFLDYYKGNTTYRLYSFALTNDGESYVWSSNQTTTDFRMVIANRLDMIMQLLNYFCSHWWNYYYPLDNTLPEYWRYYNTDTAQQEEIGLAGLMYNISWYLGQMYVLQSASESLDNFTDQVEAVTETFEEAEEKEQDIIDSISSGIESFNPDLSELGTFKALGWCSNYLQLVFLRLGTYGTVILIGLLLGVCMQFIGYFRYKT